MADANSTASSPIPQPPDHLSVLPPDTAEDGNPTDAMEASAEPGCDEVAPPGESTSGECSHSITGSESDSRLTKWFIS